MKKNESTVIFDSSTELDTKLKIKNRSNFSVKQTPNGLGKPFQVTWKELSYSVRQTFSFQRRTILNNVSGFIKSGSFMAVMGPSGCGKTSLLNCISGNIRSGIKGSVSISLDKQVKISFVGQEDYLFRRLSVRESLLYASKLKNGKRVDHEVVVDSMVSKLQLEKCADHRPDKCSGGQRKRLSIGLELVSQPNILILDEPTSGLDTTTTKQLITTLISLAKQSEPIAIMATIHQPSSLLYQLFDSLYLLSFDGQCLYHGSPLNLLPLLLKFNLICPKYHNPADFALEVASNEYGIGKVMMLSTIMRIDALDIKAHNYNIKISYKSTSKSHIWLLTQRSFMLSFRDPYTLSISIVAHISCAILVAILFGADSGKLSGCHSEIMSMNGSFIDNYNHVYYDVNENISCLFFMNMNVWFFAIFPILLSFPQEMNIFLKEYNNGWYSCFSYFMAKVLSDIPFQLTIPNLFSITSYKTSGQLDEVWRVYCFALIGLLFVFTANSMGLMISAVFMRHAMAAVFMGCIISFPMLFFSGYMKRLNRLSSLFKWFADFNFVRYGFEATLVTVYGYDRCEHLSGGNVSNHSSPPVFAAKSQNNSLNDNLANVLNTYFSSQYNNNDNQRSIALKSFDINDDNLIISIVMLVAIMLAFRVLTYLVLFSKVKNN